MEGGASSSDSLVGVSSVINWSGAELGPEGILIEEIRTLANTIWQASCHFAPRSMPYYFNQKPKLCKFVLLFFPFKYL